MRYMIMHKMTPWMEAGEPPPADLFGRIDAFITEAVEAGVFITGDGLGSTKTHTSRLTIDTAGKVTVKDGPFAETKELIAGFSMIEVDTHDEAVEWARKFVVAHGGDLEVDVRRVLELEDVAPDAAS